MPGCQHVGINESEDESRYISIYPNPVADRLYVYFNAPHETFNYDLKIYSLEGKEIRSISKLQNNSTYILDTSLFQNGTYLAAFFKNNQLISSQKIIKQ